MTPSTVNQLATSGNLLSFAFESHKVRISDQQGDPWFILRDLLEAMDSTTKLSDAVDSIKQGLGDGWVANLPIVDSMGRDQTAIIVAEPAATYLLSRSNTDKGRELNRFVHVEVLPNIRKTGTYAVPQTTGDALVQMALAYREHERRIMHLEAEQTQTKQVIAELIGGEDYTTAKGYARTHKLSADRAFLCAVGKQASKLCKARGLHVGKVTDEAWDTVNSYPRDHR
jgi:prophage antirepressor-like protein